MNLYVDALTMVNRLIGSSPGEWKDLTGVAEPPAQEHPTTPTANTRRNPRPT